jgi:AraC-like DNA-binding protein/ligand-binding sensor protein
LIPADRPFEPGREQCAENPFCSLITTMPKVQAVCQKMEAALVRSVRERRTPQQGRCFAGLTVVAVPVLARGEPVANLLAGQVLREKPTSASMAQLSKQLAAWGVNGQWPVATRSYWETPVVSDEQFQSATGLLSVFAELLGEYAASNLLSCCPGEQPVVVKAKEFVETHLEERVTMSGMARRLGISPTHFCKTFHAATGMTFTGCVSRMRVEKAKTLLANPFMRVSEVAFACGFQAVPYFNEVFKKHTGQSPTKFRAALAASSRAAKNLKKIPIQR